MNRRLLYALALVAALLAVLVGFRAGREPVPPPATPTPVAEALQVAAPVAPTFLPVVVAEAEEDPAPDTGAPRHPGTAVDPDLPWNPGNLEKARFSTLKEAVDCMNEAGGDPPGPDTALEVRIGPTDVVSVTMIGGEGIPEGLRNCLLAAPTLVTWPSPSEDKGFVVPLHLMHRPPPKPGD